MSKLFETQEIGSLAKPRWRIEGFKGKPLSKDEIAEAVNWGKRLRIENLDTLATLLNEKDSAAKRKAILDWSAKCAIQFFEIVGLDVVFDGEQWRSEMYEHVIRNVDGFEFLGYVKSFDYRYFNKAACIKKPRYATPFYLDEFIFTKENTKKKVKVPFTGPYTLADWTFNEYYEKKLSLNTEISNFKHRKSQAKRDFVFDLIKEVIRPEIKKLVDSGAEWIQIDEPAATTDPADEEMKLFVESFNQTVKGFNCTFSLHNCYSDYQILAKHACELKNCSQLALEFANRDSKQNGTAYKEIALFDDYGFNGSYGLGVIDVHSDFIEPPELVRNRILRAAEIVDDVGRIHVNPDCGLRTRTWDVSFTKLKNMVLGAQMARYALK